VRGVRLERREVKSERWKGAENSSTIFLEIKQRVCYQDSWKTSSTQSLKRQRDGEGLRARFRVKVYGNISHFHGVLPKSHS